MSGHRTEGHPQAVDSVGVAPHRHPADVAYRRAWWSFALYPVTLLAAFVIGEGLLSMLTEDTGNPAVWQVLMAAPPALLVFVVPGILAVVQGRRAIKLGRSDGKVPAIVGVAVGIGFVGMNLMSYVVGLVFG